MSYDHVPTASPAVRGLAVTFGAALIGAHLTLALASCSGGCSQLPAPVVDSAQFAGELEYCMQTSASCVDYVACQHAVQRRYDQPLSGSCDVVVDGGDQ